MKSFYFIIMALLFVNISGAQFKVETFGKFEKVKAGPDKPIDFKTVFPLKAQVYVQLSYPSEPAFYTIECYRVDESGQEKLTGTTDIKTFEPKSKKTISSVQSLGMMYDAGSYKIKAFRQSDKSVVAGKLCVCGSGNYRYAACRRKPLGQLASFRWLPDFYIVKPEYGRYPTIWCKR